MKAFLFPGQGSQVVGMGFDFYNKYKVAKDIFYEANEICNLNLSDLIFNGNATELKKTKNSQVAIATTSIAILEILKERNLFDINNNQNFTAGHSLGEYVSLYYANSISFEDTIKLLLERGKIMDEIKLQETGMASILGIESNLIKEIIRNINFFNTEHLEIANFNSKTQTVISGHLSAIEKFKIYIIEKKIPAKVIILDLEKAFHSKLMLEAEEKFTKVLEKISLKKPEKNIITNCDAALLINENDIKEKLLKNITTGVKWKQTINQLIKLNIKDFYSIGVGNALINMIKRDHATLNSFAITNINDII